MREPPGGRLSVRPVRAGEHAVLRELRLAALAVDPEVFASTYAREAGRSASWWHAQAQRSEAGLEGRTFVLVDETGRWLGLSSALVDPHHPGIVRLLGMWVAPQARGRGGAGRLCEACGAWAAERGARELELHVVIGNEPARRAYAAAGFAVRERTTWTAHGRTLQELVMVRTL
ncbi:MAG: GNAT family N-acetyltransferase [Solirubrobacterales bacterium]|nr:GNAT family N-acetyltransferase [Solirubrobacterales bacterium]